MEWIRQQLESEGISQHELAGAVGLTSVQMNKILTGYRQLKSTEADKIRRFFGLRLPEDPRPTTLIVGKVGAGSVVELNDPYEKGAGHEVVYLPPTIEQQKVVAVEVDGDSMNPIYKHGDLLFFTRETYGVPSECLNENCICCDSQGRSWVKWLKVGERTGYFHLISLNPTSENLLNVKLDWAAKVVLHLPRSLVEWA